MLLSIELKIYSNININKTGMNLFKKYLKIFERFQFIFILTAFFIILILISTNLKYIYNTYPNFNFLITYYAFDLIYLD